MFALFKEGPRLARARVGTALTASEVQEMLAALRDAWTATKPGRAFTINGIDGIARWSDGKLAFTIEADPLTPADPQRPA